MADGLVGDTQHIDTNYNQRSWPNIKERKKKTGGTLHSKKLYIRGSLNKFPDFFRIGTFIDSTHMKL